MHTERTVVLYFTITAQISTFFYFEPFPSNYSLKHVALPFKYRENHLQVPRSPHLSVAHQLVSIFQVHQSWRVFPDLPATGPNRNDRHQIHQGWCYKNRNTIHYRLCLGIQTHFFLIYLPTDDSFALHHSRNYTFVVQKELTGVINWKALDEIALFLSQLILPRCLVGFHSWQGVKAKTLRFINVSQL